MVLSEQQLVQNHIYCKKKLNIMSIFAKKSAKSLYKPRSRALWSLLQICKASGCKYAQAMHSTSLEPFDVSRWYHISGSPKPVPCQTTQLLSTNII